jgi:hypothetical protein
MRDHIPDVGMVSYEGCRIISATACRTAVPTTKLPETRFGKPSLSPRQFDEQTVEPLRYSLP